MEPLSALSLAGTIVQFVDFGSKLISRGYELYHSTNGQLAAHHELELMISDLQNVIIRIKENSVMEIENPFSAGLQLDRLDSSTSSALQRISLQTIEVVQEILSKLEGMKINVDKTKSKFETFRQVCARLWKGKKEQEGLDQLQERLEALKDAVDREVLVIILNNTKHYDLRLSNLFERLDGKTQLILDAMTRDQNEITQEIRLSTAHLLSRNKGFAQGLYHQKRDRVAESWKKDTEPPAQIKVDIEMFPVSEVDEIHLRNRICDSILYSLKYPAMSHRYELLAEAHPYTFEWAFRKSSHQDVSWSNLAEWLRTGEGLYWISGKPGSGKSTLMKHVHDDPRTGKFLRQWAGVNNRLRVATFFFWNSGTREQRSLSGMLRSLLFQILEKEQDLIPVIFPDKWAAQYAKVLDNRLSEPNPWSIGRLLKAFKAMCSQMVIDVKICLLIDGLDELDGDHELLADLFSQICNQALTTPNLKICLASRPWNVYRESFSQVPSLQVQAHTMEDIKLYVIDKFNANTPFQRLAKKDTTTASSLAAEIVQKAEGVFIWVYIVVRDLLTALRDRESIADIWKRLNSLPRDLEPLYEHIKSQIDPLHLSWTSSALQLVRARLELGAIPTAKLMSGDPFTSELLITEDDMQGGCLSVVDVYLALDETLTYDEYREMTEDQIEDKSETTDFQITARCACLLEVRHLKDKNHVTSKSLVQYLHRTARDFIENKSRWTEILRYTGDTSFNPYTSLMRYQSFQLYRSLPETNHSVDPPEIDIAVRILIYASYADTHVPSRLQQLEYLNATAEILSRGDSFAIDWVEPIIIPGAPLELTAPFTRMALVLNLSGYISSLLKNNWQQNSTVAKLSASCLLWLGIGTEESYVFHVNGLSQMSLQMATALIERNADVNYKPAGSDKTAWQRFLARSMPSLAEESQQTTIYNPGIKQLMDLFLSNGADLGVIIETVDSGACFDLNLLQYIENYIRKSSPADAVALKQKVEELLQSKLSSHLGQLVADNGYEKTTVLGKRKAEPNRYPNRSRNFESST